MWCCWLGKKAGLNAKIIRLEPVYNDWEEVKSEIIIYEKIHAYTIKVGSNISGDALAEHTSHTKRTIKVWKKLLIKIWDLVKLTQKWIELWTFEIEDLDPKVTRGRMQSIYLYLKKYNEN